MKIHNKGKSGYTPACRYAQFSSREEAIKFRNEQYLRDLCEWKLSRSLAHVARNAGMKGERRAKTIHRPMALAIHWPSLTLRFVKIRGDWEREMSNNSGRFA